MSAELMGSAPHWFRCFGVDEHRIDGEHSLLLEMLREMRREWMGSALHQYKWEVGTGSMFKNLDEKYI
jgi:hypothetical protein